MLEEKEDFEREKEGEKRKTDFYRNPIVMVYILSLFSEVFLSIL